MKKVLIIDDDKEMSELLQEFLKQEEMDASAVHDGAKGLQTASQPGWDMVILDVLLPEMNGFEVLRKLRAVSRVPVIMLTARGDEIDRVLGLESGADDYLPKPFSPRELAARIRAVFRRIEGESDPMPPSAPEQITVGDLEMFPASRSARIGGKNLDLTNMEYQVLEYLVRRAGSQVSREELVTRVLERAYSPFDRSVDMHVSNLRRKLGTYPDGIERIRMLRGAGYLYAKPLK